MAFVCREIKGLLTLLIYLLSLTHSCNLHLFELWFRMFCSIYMCKHGLRYMLSCRLMLS